MAIILIAENIKQSGWKEIPAYENNYTNGYVKLDRDAIKDILPYKDFKSLVKRGCYFEGVDSEKESDIYIHRLVGAIHYSIVGKECHHLDCKKIYSMIINIIPLDHGIHQTINSWGNARRGIEKSLELEKELQIEQFSKTKRKRWTVQSDVDVVADIINLIATEVSKNQIKETYKDKMSNKTLSKYINYFYYSKDFLEFLENQNITEFTDLFSILGEEWRFVVDWEKNKDKNLQEFEEENSSDNDILQDLALIPSKISNEEESYTSCIEDELSYDVLESIFG